MNCKVIFDFDDAIYLEGPEETGGRIRRKFLNDSISESAQTIVGSPILAEYAHNYTNNVRCIPTPIPKENYVNRQSIKSNDGTLLVWIGYPENIRYLKTISGPITTILDKYEDVQLRIITADSSSVDLFSGRNDVEFCEWSLDTALDNLAEGNIGVRPLINDEWTQAKGGFTSVVEMMAIGMPVVVTPIGFLKKFVEDGVSGFHASTDDEWETALSQLVEDEELRDRMGNNAITAVDKKGLWTTNYSEKLIDVLESVID
jgi:glycosyltransferase involved in cell wall biosynthesis